MNNVKRVYDYVLNACSTLDWLKTCIRTYLRANKVMGSCYCSCWNGSRNQFTNTYILLSILSMVRWFYSETTTLHLHIYLIYSLYAQSLVFLCIHKASLSISGFKHELFSLNNSVLSLEISKKLFFYLNNLCMTSIFFPWPVFLFLWPVKLIMTSTGQGHLSLVKGTGHWSWPGWS